MKILPFILLSLIAVGCTSDQQNDQNMIQREEDIQMQEEELQRTGAADYQEDSTATSPYSVD
jgi:hypothetical protein